MVIGWPGAMMWSSVVVGRSGAMMWSSVVVGRSGAMMWPSVVVGWSGTVMCPSVVGRRSGTVVCPSITGRCSVVIMRVGSSVTRRRGPKRRRHEQDGHQEKCFFHDFFLSVRGLFPRDPYHPSMMHSGRPQRPNSQSRLSMASTTMPVPVAIRRISWATRTNLWLAGGGPSCRATAGGNS